MAAHILVFISFSIAISIFLETVGVWARAIGAAYGQPTRGYSTHVRVATLGRFFVLIAAPILGFIVDSGDAAKNVALIGVFVFVFTSALSWTAMYVPLRFYFQLYERTYRNSLGGHPNLPDPNGKSVKNAGFIFLSILSFMLTAIGIIVVNYFAALNPEYRASIVQMTALITTGGTIIHIFFVDPRLASAADVDVAAIFSLARDFVWARLIASLILVFGFGIVYALS